jgi:leader peptidase (prepilin peptidase) / N-methyltransferase
MTGLQHVIIAAFFWLLGMSIGSFLNVVLYRLPRGLSVNKPRRSFCPRCSTELHWRDNIPVLSWLRLGGKCRACRAPISVQYPLVEALTGLLFTLTYFLLFVGGARAGLLAPSLPTDAPYLLAWLVLVSVMLVSSVFDLTTFMIDTRVTNVAVIAGVALNTLWPRETLTGPVAADSLGFAALVAAAVAVALLAWSVTREPPEPEPAPEDTPPTPSPANRPVGVLATIAMLVLTLWLLMTTALVPHVRDWVEVLPVPAAFLAIFAAIILVGGQQRPADDELAAALAEEEPLARGVALRELLWLLPIIVAGTAAYLLAASTPLGTQWAALAAWSPGFGLSPESPRTFHPIAGLVFALHGWIIAAAAGWVLRIFFTLVFGREAFGVGDIYILAAAGATAGWDIALLGLMFSVGLALVGWIIGLTLKHSIMIPFGPWLALGFLVALWMNQPASEVIGSYADSIRLTAATQPQLLAVAGGLMLVGCAAAILLAKGVRRMVEPDSD